jgi:hypothetical protein
LSCVGGPPAFSQRWTVGRLAPTAPEYASCGRSGVELYNEVRTFDTVEELRRALLEFRDAYNATWLIERHGFRTPDAVRQEQLQPAALAA